MRLVLDLATYERAFEPAARRDLECAQTAGIVEAFRDEYRAGTCLAHRTRRATWLRAVATIGRWSA